jgi:transposase
MRSIVRRDNGQRYEAFLTELAKKSGIATPNREDLARIDRKRKKKGSNQEWMSATDPDARIAKMKDGSTHMAHKAEHAVDMERGAVIAVTLQAADQGDTTTIHETLAEAGEAVAELIEREAEKSPEAKPQVHLNGITEMVADKGYHSGKTVMELGQVEVRSYIPEPQRGRRKWEGKAEEQKAVYGNRRRVRSSHGKQLLKKRGELIERSFAHCYETGAMRRTHLRGRENILKRQLIHVCAFNLSLIFRLSLGAGTPRELRNRQAGPISAFIWLQAALMALEESARSSQHVPPNCLARSCPESPTPKFRGLRHRLLGLIDTRAYLRSRAVRGLSRKLSSTPRPRPYKSAMCDRPYCQYHLGHLQELADTKRRRRPVFSGDSTHRGPIGNPRS